MDAQRAVDGGANGARRKAVAAEREVREEAGVIELAAATARSRRSTRD
jgi:hypothetical protein